MSRRRQPVDVGEQQAPSSLFTRRRHLHQRARHGLCRTRSRWLGCGHEEQQLPFTAAQIAARVAVHEHDERSGRACRTATAVSDAAESRPSSCAISSAHAVAGHFSNEPYGDAGSVADSTTALKCRADRAASEADRARQASRTGPRQDRIRSSRDERVRHLPWP